MKDDPKGKSSLSLTSAPPAEDHTRVDLGDDLLEKTRLLAEDVKGSVSDSILVRGEAEILDQLQSAQILIGEGIFEEAKKILRKILIADPRRLRARQLLEQIHEKELKELFAESPRRRFFGSRSGQAEEDLSGILTEEVIRELDRDLRLGIFNPDGSYNPITRDSDQSFPLASDPQVISDYANRLDAELTGLSAQDRVDLGIAFLEMGLYEIAIRQLKTAANVYLQESLKQESASNSATSDPEGNSEATTKGVLVATSLLAYALILAGKGYEAAQLVQAFIRDLSIPAEHKIEFVYLMGRAYEAMNELVLAKSCYEQVGLMDSSYRDVDARLRRFRSA